MNDVQARNVNAIAIMRIAAIALPVVSAQFHLAKFRVAISHLIKIGKVPEWTNGPVLKTVTLIASWVRIPPFPPK